MRFFVSCLTLCVVFLTEFCLVTPFVFAAETESEGIDRLQAAARLADKIEQVAPEFAADCRFANTLSGMLADDYYVKVVGVNKTDFIQDAGFFTDVWGLVMYRESLRLNKEPMNIRGPFMKANGRAGLTSRKRMTSSIYSRLEKQLRVCYLAAFPPAESENGTTKVSD